MPASLVMTFIGQDRPGLVNVIASRVSAQGAAWLESKLARLSGEFAGIVRVEAPDDKVAALIASLRQLEADGLIVTVHAAGQAPLEQRASAKIELLCLDRPGIVSEVTQTLWSLGANIEEFDSGLTEAAFTGQPMFKATIRLFTPPTLTHEELRRRLERLAGELMADIVISDETA